MRDAAANLKFGVGPWHLGPHQAICHVLFNPAYMTGCGLTNGDAIERKWADLRRYNNISSFMASGNRQDLISSLVRPWDELRGGWRLEKHMRLVGNRFFSRQI